MRFLSRRELSEKLFARAVRFEVFRNDGREYRKARREQIAADLLYCVASGVIAVKKEYQLLFAARF